MHALADRPSLLSLHRCRDKHILLAARFIWLGWNMLCRALAILPASVMVRSQDLLLLHRSVITILRSVTIAMPSHSHWPAPHRQTVNPRLNGLQSQPSSACLSFAFYTLFKAIFISLPPLSLGKERYCLPWAFVSNSPQQEFNPLKSKSTYHEIQHETIIPTNIVIIFYSLSCKPLLVVYKISNMVKTG